LCELYKKLSVCPSESFSPTSAPHPIVVESHVGAAKVVGNILTGDETFALIMMELFEALQARYRSLQQTVIECTTANSR
jgi:hypothetical protein